MDKLNYIAKLENAIEERWGKEAVDNPRKFWNEDKKEEYEKECKELRKRIFKNQDADKKIERPGYLISESILFKDSRENCEACGKYSFESRDDLYLSRFNACFECYVKYIEDREKRWKSGWRPNNNENV